MKRVLLQGPFRKKPGRFEISRGGTIFLEKISNMPMNSQGKLLSGYSGKADLAPWRNQAHPR